MCTHVHVDRCEDVCVGMSIQSIHMSTYTCPDRSLWHMSTHVSTRISIHMYQHVHTYVYKHAYTHAHTHVYAHV